MKNANEKEILEFNKVLDELKFENIEYITIQEIQIRYDMIKRLKKRLSKIHEDVTLNNEIFVRSIER